jgi:uncharacterized membrane protein
MLTLITAIAVAVGLLVPQIRELSGLWKTLIVLILAVTPSIWLSGYLSSRFGTLRKIEDRWRS